MSRLAYLILLFFIFLSFCAPAHGETSPNLPIIKETSSTPGAENYTGDNDDEELLQLITEVVELARELFPYEIFNALGLEDTVKQLAAKKLSSVTPEQLKDQKAEEIINQIKGDLELLFKGELNEYIKNQVSRLLPEQVMPLVADTIDKAITTETDKTNLENIHTIDLNVLVGAVKDNLQAEIDKKIEEMVNASFKNAIPEEVLNLLPEEMRDTFLEQMQSGLSSSVSSAIKQQIDKALLDLPSLEVTIPAADSLESIPLSVIGIGNIPGSPPEEIEEFQDVSPLKSWTVIFSEDIDPDSTGQIYVSRDPAGIFRIPALVTFLPRYGNMLSVKPKISWDAGTTYYLFIDGVKSAGGKSLQKPANIVFTVKDEEPYPTLLEMAQQMLNEAKIPEAIELAESAMEQNPLDYQGLMSRAMAYMQIDPQQALEDLINSAALNPNDGEMAFLSSFLSQSEAETETDTETGTETETETETEEAGEEEESDPFRIFNLY